MNTKKLAFAKLRDLSGAPLVVLFAMLIEKKPVTQQYLSLVLRRDRKTISKALTFLEFEGYIQRANYRAWCLPASQLALPGFTVGLLSPPNGREGRNSRFEWGDSPHSSTTTTTVDVTQVEEAVVSNAETGEIPLSAIPDDVAHALREINVQGDYIGRHRWPEIAACEWVTASYLRATAARVNAHQSAKYRNTGFLIHCILAGDPAPDWCDECEGLNGEHNDTCNTNRKRYVEGKYAHLINH